VVEEANAIGTTYLRAQTLAEPVRTGSLERLVRCTDTSIQLSHSVPGTPAASQAAADGQQLQRELWALAGQALEAAPTANAPRLYVESLNQMIDLQTVRVSDQRCDPGPDHQHSGLIDVRRGRHRTHRTAQRGGSGPLDDDSAGSGRLLERGVGLGVGGHVDRQDGFAGRLAREGSGHLLTAELGQQLVGGRPAADCRQS
jgi:hypothetical protein